MKYIILYIHIGVTRRRQGLTNCDNCINSCRGARSCCKDIPLIALRRSSWHRFKFPTDSKLRESHLIDIALSTSSCGQFLITSSTTMTGHRHSSSLSRLVTRGIVVKNFLQLLSDSPAISIFLRSRCCVPCLCRVSARPSQSVTWLFFIRTVFHRDGCAARSRHILQTRAARSSSCTLRY